MLKEALEALIDFFLPGFCLFCGARLTPAAGSLACPPCLESLARVPQPWCACCGGPFWEPGGEEAWCRECRADPPPFSRARAVAFYEGQVLEAIHRLKYQRQIIYAEFLRQLLADSPAGDLAASADLVVPVPLHPRRLRQRGFNQALLLAQAFPHLPLGREILVRRRPTRPQVELSAMERRANVQGAFLTTQPAGVASKAVLLVDDVYTTGATVRECSQALLQAGAARVEVVTVARVGYV